MIIGIYFGVAIISTIVIVTIAERRYIVKNKFSYKDKAEKIRRKIIREESNKFKKLCIKEFEDNIEKGITTTIVDFWPSTPYEFENEISEIVLNELKENYKTIEFSFSYRHYKNSYKGIKMVAI